MNCFISIEGQDFVATGIGSAREAIVRNFENLEIELPSVPRKDDRLNLFRNGLHVAGTVDYVCVNWYQAGNGLTSHGETTAEYLVRLKDVCLNGALDESLLERKF